MKKTVIALFSVLLSVFLFGQRAQKSSKKPNIIVIYLDDLGYGDVSYNNPSTLKTPNIDKLAQGGQIFRNGYATSATCTPSRYALLTGVYPWRNKEAKILPGSAPLIVSPNQMTIPKMLKAKGYYTGVIGKWHLGLGTGVINWNEKITPSPNEVGFDYSNILAATQDRVPTVYIQNGLVVGLDPKDPIEVDYDKNFPGEPTGANNPELLKIKWHHGHNNSIVNGISRIGFMRGGDKAKWVDEDMADYFLNDVNGFVKKHKNEPFFLYYALQQPHVPRTPHPRFEGKSGLGPRGDAILEADWCIGELVKTLENEGLLDNTLIVFSSDNGPVLNDGYYDDAVEKLGDHKPAGLLRGGKYSLFDAGTHVPFFTYWKGTIKPGVSDALVCQIDLLSSLAGLVGSDERVKDSEDLSKVFLGRKQKGRKSLIVEATSRTALRQGDWIMIPPYSGEPLQKAVNIEVGNAKEYQLYNVKEDIGQTNNLAKSKAKKLKEMVSLFNLLRGTQEQKVEEIELK